MNSRRPAFRSMLAVSVVVLGVIGLSPRSALADPSDSVVSLLAPAHGSAFAFGRPGHLLTLKSALKGRQTAKIVTQGGQVETVAVAATNDRQVVQLRGRLKLPPLLKGGRLHPGDSVVVGPLAAAGTPNPVPCSGSVGATRNISEGAPCVDAARPIVGLVDRRGEVLRLVPVGGIRPLSRPRSWIVSRGSELPPTVAILMALAFGIGLGLARLMVSSRVQRRLAQRRRPRRREPPVPPPGDEEMETLVRLVPRVRQETSPAPDVRLLYPSSSRTETGESDSAS